VTETLLERDDELERLERALELAAAGQGSLLLLEGPAGIGKTSLLERARERAEERGMRVLAARATEIERDFPYGAIRQLIDPLIRGASAEQRDSWLAGAAAPAAAVLGIPPTGPATPEPGAGTLHALHWLFGNLADETPCLLLLDDAQWADRDSLRFLAFLSPRLRELPVLAIAAARAEEPDALADLAATASDPGSRPIAPAALSAAATRALLARRFTGAVAPEFAQACHHATGGNPFFLRALTDVLVEDGVEPTAHAAEAALSLGPQTVTRAVVTRVARLPEEAASLARALAVLGDGAAFDDAVRLAGVDAADARTAVDRLAAAGILDSGPALTFAHPILGNALYADIGRSERADLHQRAAALLGERGAAAEKTAAHLLATEPAGATDAVELLRAAAGDAIRRGAPDSAVAHLRRALAEPPQPEQRSDVLLELGRVELAVDGRVAAEHLAEALTLNEEPAARAAIVRTLAQACFSTGDVEAGLAALRAEVEAGRGDHAGAVEVELIVALSAAPSLELLREADDRVERLAGGLAGASVEERLALDCLGFCRLRSGVHRDAVVTPLRDRLERTPADELIPPVHQLMTIGVLIRCDELDLAERWARRALAEAQAAGSVYGTGGAHWLVGGVEHRRGQLAEAVSSFDTALRLARDYGAALGVQSSLTGLLDAHIDRGERDDAVAALSAAGLDGSGLESLAGGGELLESRARLHLAMGKAEAALADFEAAARFFKERGDSGPGIATWRQGAARAHQALGRDEEAARLAREGLERALTFGAPGVISAALQAAALTGPRAQALGLLTEAVSALDDSPLRLERARALVELGAALRRSGERATARARLEEGLEIARSCAAIPLAERAYQELRAAGVRPRKVLRTGVDSLTPSETRVAQLAASGKTNREIAQELYVTPKTVEFHLGQTYRKLDISSRKELPSALEREA